MFFNPLNAELFPGHCTVMLDNIRKISNVLITNFELLFHPEEVCQFEIKMYESCSEITEVFFSCLYFTVKPFKVTVNVFWVKISIFQFFHILLAELSRHTMIPCLKPTEVLKMEEISYKRRLPQFLNQSFLFVVFKIHT